MSTELKCDVCNGTDYSELNSCHICSRTYCELCEGNDNSLSICELCFISDTEDID